MSWQEDLRRYVEIEKELADLESREPEGCSCDSNEFHHCALHTEIAEVCVEQNRLMNLWGRLWVLKFYNVAQGIEPATPVYFGKEQPCQTVESTS